MERTRCLTYIFCLCLALLGTAATRAAEGSTPEIPLLITVDDLPIAGGLHPLPEERLEITEGLLATLAKHRIQAVGLVTWSLVRGDVDKALLERWLAAGHELGNHSHGHLNFSRTASQAYIDDIEAGRASLARFLGQQGKTLRFFRFPYLREGDTAAKLTAARSYLETSGQRNLPVTLDNQDWSFEVPWVQARRAEDQAGMARVAEAFQKSLHLSIRHHRRSGDSLFGRPVPQILLLHANAVGAAQWDRLFTWLQGQGFRFATADEVLSDPALAISHSYVGPRGFGLWDRLASEKRGREARAEIEALIDRQVAAWNRGDLEAFCADYAEDTLFVSPSGLTRGRGAVLARYRKRYPDRKTQGLLAIEALEISTPSGTEISMLGDARPGRVHTASMVGRWSLSYTEQPEKESATGLTLLLLERRGQGWTIVRDASM